MTFTPNLHREIYVFDEFSYQIVFLRLSTETSLHLLRANYFSFRLKSNTSNE